MSTPEYREKKLQEEIDRLARLCEEKDTAYEQLKETTFKSLDYANEEMRELETKVAMQAEALFAVFNTIPAGTYYCPPHMQLVKDALSATSETVAAWRAKETEALRRKMAMLREYSSNFLKFLCADETHPISSSKLRLAVADTQSTALAYEREVENRGAVKALEDLVDGLDDEEDVSAWFVRRKAEKYRHPIEDK